MSSSLRIIVTGLIGQHPLGGVTWDYIQYVLGLARLGHDVYYFEDTGEWPYRMGDRLHDKDDLKVADCSYNVAYLGKTMARFGLEGRWAFRCPIDSQWFGLPDGRRNEVIQCADLLINVSGTLMRPEAYRSVRRLAYIDSDPVFTQIKLARAEGRFPERVNAHDVHFSFGEHLSETVPATGHEWRPTRSPIVLSEWHTDRHCRRGFTTVMNWTSYYPLIHDGRKYGQKDMEFGRFLDLPGLIAPTTIEVAIRKTAPKRRRVPDNLVDRLETKGWRVADPAQACPDPDSYRDYVETSKAEWSVAKNGYVIGQPGWFSCRSACYLAAGRPVVVQDTGFRDVLPVGEGILTFGSIEEAVDAIREVESNYNRHARAARQFAEEYFDSDKILNRLISEAMAPQEVRP